MSESIHRSEPHETPDVSGVSNPEVSHERSDVNAGGILVFVVGMVVFGAIVSVLMVVLYKYLNAREMADQPKLTPMAMRTEQERLPPQSEPHLQGAPGDGEPNHNFALKPPDEEGIVMRQEAEQALSSYGPMDPADQTVKAPIDNAMKMLLQKGLPVRTDPLNTEDMLHGINVPEFSSSGRTMEKETQ